MVRSLLLFFLIYLLPLLYTRSFHPSPSSSTLVWSSWHFYWLVHGNTGFHHSDLTSRTFRHAVSIQNSMSSFSNLSCSVPQGSARPWPTFVINSLYTTPLGSVISKNSIKYHLYAGDRHPVIGLHFFQSFKFNFFTWNLSIQYFLWHTFLDELQQLLLNPSKTEFLLIGTKQQRHKFSQLTFSSLSNDRPIIPVSSSARTNLGFIFIFWHVIHRSNKRTCASPSQFLEQCAVVVRVVVTAYDF